MYDVELSERTLTCQTQLQILTAVVKLFLKKPSNNQGLVQKVLQQATADSDNPDIRDRAYIYWRLLSGDLDVAKVRSHQFAAGCMLTVARALFSHKNHLLPRQ